MSEALKEQAARMLKIAEELEKAAVHAKIAADHFKSGEVPRACAHTVATEGHLVAAQEGLAEVAKTHRIAAKLA